MSPEHSRTLRSSRHPTFGRVSALVPVTLHLFHADGFRLPYHRLFLLNGSKGSLPSRVSLFLLELPMRARYS